MRFSFGFLAALFSILLCSSLSRADGALKFPSDFVFGVANAPGQVEDGLSDIWLDWAQRGNVRAWQNAVDPEKRLEFWTKPEVELDLARSLGVGAFRMGVDWGRVMPSRTVIDADVLNRYGQIIRMAKKRGLKVMVTLSHHSVPRWVQDSDGWYSNENRRAFLVFAQRVIDEFHGDVDSWVTFNEANVFVLMSHVLSLWPEGTPGQRFSVVPPMLRTPLFPLDQMADAHNEIYDWAHRKYSDMKIGVAHNMAHYRARNLIDRATVFAVDLLMNWRFPERIRGRMDFFGFNYYGAEWIKEDRIDFEPTAAYSEAGRAIDVQGLYELLKTISSKFKNIPIVITENGIADAGDEIRGAYVIEHLAAVHRAIAEAVPVKAYYAWTLTDNLEWSDGYCPKFGFVAVDRRTMKRQPRASFYTFQSIVGSKTVTELQRTTAWRQVVQRQGQLQPLCRAENGKTGLDLPRMRLFSKQDWRFQPTAPRSPTH